MKRSTNMKKLVYGILCFAVALCAASAFAETYRVTDYAVAPEGDGLSWGSPMSLPTAISTAVDGDTILLKAGEYDITAQISLAKAITIKGGLAGTDDTTLDPSGKTTLNSKDRSTISYIFSVSTAVADATNVFENICFTRAYKRAINKTGRSHIAFRNCRFFRNGVRLLVSKDYNGGGVYLNGGASSEAYFDSCLFDCNAHTNNPGTTAARTMMLQGAGLYANSMKRVYIDNCDFLTNCMQNVNFTSWSTAGQDGGDGGAAILANAAPLTVRSSRFIANRAPGRDTRGGTVRLTGNCNNSVFTNCLFVGNKTTPANGSLSNRGAALTVMMDSLARKVEVIDCTFAYNYSYASTSAAGLLISGGTALVRNSIFYGNHVADSSHTAHYGRDIVVIGGSGYADVDYSLITGEGEYNLSSELASNLALGEHIVYGDPLFGTMLSTAKTAVNANSAANVASILAFDVHEGAFGSGYSRAIDGSDPASPYANEPAPNGGVRNLGYYGNTAEAATSQTGVPVLTASDIAITFADDTVPTVTATLGGDDMYNASVKIELAKTSGGAAAESVGRCAVQPGETVTLAGVDLYEPGSTVYVTVTVTVPGQTPIVVEKSATVTGTLPPYYGHGGGANVIHVRQGAKGRKDGTSWTDAFDSFTLAQKALAGDATKTEIWVAGKITESFAPSTVTIAAPLVIRGGFAGVEDSIAERPEGTLSTLDGANSYNLLRLANAAANPLAVERLVFTRAGQYAFVNSGGGALAVTNCQFNSNQAPGGDVEGRGVYLSGAFTASFTNCAWRGNMKTGSGSSQAQGSAIYASGLSRLFLDDCLFVTNGVSPTSGLGEYTAGRDKADGDCIWMSGTPLTARNCHFRGNRGAVRRVTSDNPPGYGGVILLAGASGNSAFTNCTFTGNWGGWATTGLKTTTTMTRYGGTIDIRLSTASSKVDFESCTLAYNLGDTLYIPGGLHVEVGKVNMHNCIIFGNRHGQQTVAGIGHDIHVRGSSSLNLSYCRLAAEDPDNLGVPLADYVSVASTATFTCDNLTFGDPLFATSLEDFTSRVKVVGSGNYAGYSYIGTSYNVSKNTIANTGYANANFDVHLRSIAGMSRNDGTRYEDEGNYSPAIDAGDPDSAYANEPDPNGERVNLGAYGNTAEASCTVAGIQPEIGEIEVSYSNNIARPYITIPIRGNGAFLAGVQVLIGTGDVATVGYQYTNSWSNVMNGTDLYAVPFKYVFTGDVISWHVVVSAENAQTRVADGSAVVPVGPIIPAVVGEIEVTYSNNIARPFISIPILGESNYVANVYALVGTGDVATAGYQYTNSWSGVASGTGITMLPHGCVAGGDTVSWRILVVDAADPADAHVVTGSAVVPEGLEIPAIYGKGGGDGVIHVGPGYIGSMHDGSNWWDAFETVAEAVAAVTADRCEIWVAADATNRMPTSISLSKQFKTVFRGGFTGYENSVAERPDGLLTVVDNSGGAMNNLALSGSSAVAFERFQFDRAKQRAMTKSGSGDLDLVSCTFVSNGFSTAGAQMGVYAGKAVAFSGTGALLVTNCYFAYNYQTNNAASTGGPGAALAVNSGRARVVDSRFFANCLQFLVPQSGSSSATLFNTWPKGSAIYAAGKVCVERCDFRANLCNTRTGDSNGGVVFFASGSSGSAVSNCLFAGNVDRASWNSQASSRTGAIVLELGAKAQTVDIFGSTFAYNLADTSAGSAGITVVVGTANVKNCVFTGNHIRRGAINDTGDLRVVGANGVVNLSYSVLDGNLDAVRASCSGEFNDGTGVVSADPLVVTRPESVTNLIAYTGTYYYYPGGTSTLAKISGIDVHLLSRGGYVTNGAETVWLKSDVISPAIDAADPFDDYSAEPMNNGGRRNAGVYGGTAEASKTYESEIPLGFDGVQVDYPSGYSNPRITFTVTGDPGCVVAVTVHGYVGGEPFSTTLNGCVAGETYEYLLPSYYPRGTSFSYTLSGSSTSGPVVGTSGSGTVDADLPPWWGHGGGASVLHVWSGALGDGSGSDWHNACRTWNEMVSAYAARETKPSEIWFIDLGSPILAPNTLTVTADLAMRGGFDYLCDSVSDRAAGARSVLDARRRFALAKIANASASVMIERLEFTRSASEGLVKEGAGNLDIRDCVFFDNAVSNNEKLYGRGLNVSGTAATTQVSVSNCLFACNGQFQPAQGVNPYYLGYGGAAAFRNVKRVLIDSCAFLTNGVPLAASGQATIGGDVSQGSALYLNNAPATIRGSVFLSNHGTCRPNDYIGGGAIRFVGNCDGSAMTNCLVAGCSDRCGWNEQYGLHGGAISVTMGSSAYTLDIVNTTVAYNLADGNSSPGGINVYTGAVSLRNSIVCNNFSSHRAVSGNRFGSDVDVKATGSLYAEYTLFTSGTTNSLSAADGAVVSLGPGLVFGDPLFVTSMSEVMAKVESPYGSGYTNFKTGNDNRDYLANLSLHLRGGRGYYDEKTGALSTEFMSRDVVSPAVDAGDPNSSYADERDCPQGWHGRRVNMGYYGNTAWATMTAFPGGAVYLR